MKINIRNLIVTVLDKLSKEGKPFDQVTPYWETIQADSNTDAMSIQDTIRFTESVLQELISELQK